jgi:hypothetical protein
VTSARLSLAQLSHALTPDEVFGNDRLEAWTKSAKIFKQEIARLIPELESETQNENSS